MMTPLLFNLKNKKVLVVGGGIVAARRAATLLESGAQVICISPEFSADLLNKKDNRNILIQDVYKRAQLSDIDLAVAATDNRELNKQIKMDCESLKIWCNRVDDPEDSDFIFPSVIRRGDLTLSVCTEGASPFLTKSIVADLSQRYDESYVQRTALLRELREKILAGTGSKEEKAAELKALSRHPVEALKERMEKIELSDLNTELTIHEWEKDK